MYLARIFSAIRKKSILRKRESYASMLREYEQDSKLEHFSRLSAPALLLFMLKDSQLEAEKKKELVSRIILPKLVPYKNSSDWMKRYNLLSCFQYYIDARYYSVLTKLIRDYIPIIRINACQIGSEIADEQIYQAILDVLLHSDHASRTLYIDNFQANKEIWPFLLKQLEQTENTLLKKIIYDILLRTGCDASFFPVAREDSLSAGRNVRLAVIRLLPYTDHKEVLPTLKIILEDSEWRVRNAAVQALAALKKTSVIPLIAEKLQDKEWWVRVSAAKVLAQSGNKGLQMLEAHKELLPEKTGDYAAYFLEIAEIRRELHA